MLVPVLFVVFPAIFAFAVLRRLPMFVADIPLHLARFDAFNNSFAIMPTQATAGANFLACSEIIMAFTLAFMQHTPITALLNTAIVFALHSQVCFDHF